MLLQIDMFFLPVILAGAIAGASTGLLGVYIVGLRMPFISTCISHAALAGMVAATVLSSVSTLRLDPMAAAVFVSIAAAVAFSAIPTHRVQLDRNVTLAILFSFTMGLTFLSLGLVQGSRTEVLNYLWGSLLFADMKTVTITGILGLVLVIFVSIFHKEMQVILFSRTMAAAIGIQAQLIYTLFLALAGLILAVNLRTVGGLLIFSLVVNPAAAAYQICRGFRSVAFVSVFLGALSAVGGFMISYWYDLPTGACIVLLSSLLFALTAGIRFWSMR